MSREREGDWCDEGDGDEDGPDVTEPVARERRLNVGVNSSGALFDLPP